MKTTLKARKKIILNESQFKRLIDAISNGDNIDKEEQNSKSDNSKSEPRFQ